MKRSTTLLALSCFVWTSACDGDGPLPPGPPAACDDAACVASLGPLGPCVRAACVQGVCDLVALTDGTVCDDGDLCTTGDACALGVCEPGAAVSCDPSNDTACRVSVCSPATGLCDLSDVPDTTACEDGDLCTTGDSCQSGLCTTGSPVICDTSNDTACQVAQCSPTTGLCAPINRPDTTPCDDSSLCTTGDTCQSGTCTGAPVVCDGSSDTTCQANQCVPATGLCAFGDRPNDTPCEEGDLCTANDTCQGGICVAGGSACDPNASCDDSGGAAACACNPGWEGDGATCLPDPCGVDNGGCQQRCDDATGLAVCGCYPGFSLDADEASCNATAPVGLYNVGLELFMGLASLGAPPFAFEFAAGGLPVKLEPAAAPGTFSLTVDYTPGTCADGSVDASCIDSYRLCAQQAAVFRWSRVRANERVGEPSSWESTACTWRIEEVDGDLGEIRLKNLWLQEELPYLDYLDCWQTDECVFTHEDSTAGNTLFVLDIDECAQGSATCDPNAACLNTLGAHRCVCRDGYSGDGESCTQDDACLVDNGGCAQRCVGTATDGSALCACQPGFALAVDGTSCAPVEHLVLFNDNLDAFLATTGSGLQFGAAGGELTIALSVIDPTALTFTLGHTPGTCANGSISPSCVDTYRLCAEDDGGYVWTSLLANAQVGTPANWDTAACAWEVFDAGGGDVRLKNRAVQQNDPSADFLDCTTPTTCGFSLDEATGPGTLFTLDLDECAAGTDACDPWATCTNTRGGFDCECRPGFLGDGESCTEIDQCATGNGGCQVHCLDTFEGQAVCGCAPGDRLNPDGQTCAPATDVRIYNNGLGMFFDFQIWDVNEPAFRPFPIRFKPTSRAVRMEKTPSAADPENAYTFTTDFSPGICAGGAISPSCIDSYRWCGRTTMTVAEMYLSYKNGNVGEPADWTTDACVWLVEDLQNGQARLLNYAVEQATPWVGYLRCTNDQYCDFTFYNEDPENYSLFTFDFDECATGQNDCDPNAACTNTGGGFSCACNPGFAGDGNSCVQTDACVVGNGGCEQLCVGTLPEGGAVCECLPSFSLDGDGLGCTPSTASRIYNSGLDLFLAVHPGNFLDFESVGADVRIEPTAYGPDAFTITVYDAPGTCAGGGTSVFCPDRFRMCAEFNAGYRWTSKFSNAVTPEPPGWAAPECVWLLEPVSGSEVRLKNLWLQQTLDYWDYLECNDGFNCFFTYDEDTSGNTLFALDIDECLAGTSTCHPYADCTNSPTGFSCACMDGFVGDGFECTNVDACVVENGGCEQLCVGTNEGEAVCACLGGFVLGADGHSCEPFEVMRLFNVGQGGFLSLHTAGGPPFQPILNQPGDAVRVEPAGGLNQFTITMDASPGTCADGGVRQSCVDQYRLCARETSGFRWGLLHQTELSGPPPGWDEPECVWTAEPATDGQVRFRNLWLNDSYPYVDYLQCWLPYDCGFTYDDSTEGNTLFILDADECAAGTDDCGANARCLNTGGGFDCECNAGFDGDGYDCELVDACAVDNGGCAQVCNTDPEGDAVCGCHGGFDLAGDGQTCVPWADGARLYNVGLGAFIDTVIYNNVPPALFRFVGTGGSVRVEAVGSRPDTYTLTVDHQPGTCANGTVSNTCTDSYRLCAHNSSGMRLYAAWQSDFDGTPAEWSSSACTWIVEPVGDGTVRLQNLGIEEQYPYIDYLDCGAPYSCTFTYDGSTEGNTAFVFDRDECSDGSAACDPDATCANRGSGYSCACNFGYFGNGQSCTLTNECVVDNGGCEQICTDTDTGADCSCVPGFGLAPDGASCEPWGDVRLFNLGMGGFLDVDEVSSSTNRLLLTQTGAPVHIEPTLDGPQAFTFTMDEVPGICGDGSTSLSCVTEHRLCAREYGGFRWVSRVSHGLFTDADFDGPECVWTVEPLGEGRVQLRNLWLQETYPYVSYLGCWQDSDCTFTYHGQTSSQTTFVVDVDECAAATAVCGAYSSCVNTIDGYACPCDENFHVEGTACVPDHACVIDNGGCDQRCDDVGGVATCTCLPGFDLGVDGQSCENDGDVALYNYGLNRTLGLAFFGNAPHELGFTPAGQPLQLAPAAGRPDAFSLTMTYTPGDEYRLCAHEWSGYRAYLAFKPAGQSAPLEWDSDACAWIVERVGGGADVRLKNVWLQNERPYVDYLQCKDPYDCVFGYYENTAGNTLFRLGTGACADGSALCSDLRACINDENTYVCTNCPAGWSNDGEYGCADLDECTLGTHGCGANTTCGDVDGGYVCNCVAGHHPVSFTACELDNACTNNNGGCAQICTDVGGSAACSCFPGFDASGSTCVPWEQIGVFNDGLSLYLNVYGSELRFMNTARAVKIEPSGIRPNRFFITVDHSPGTCANGQPGPTCVDSHRMCVDPDGAFRLISLVDDEQPGVPPGWTDNACQWIIENAGTDRIRLRNVWLQLFHPYVDYLDCREYYDCGFTLEEETAGNTVFTVSQGLVNLCASVSCTALDQCHAVGVCDPVTGACNNPPQANLTPCSDGNPGTDGDTCSNGVCIGGGDEDFDGVPDGDDQCIGDDAAGNTDNDGYCNDADSCPALGNADQTDSDGDGFGDLCDNCPDVASANQANQDGDTLGDACDPDFLPDNYAPDGGAGCPGASPRPACGFVPQCPSSPQATDYNAYLFECYASEPNGGNCCLSDRWWYHLDRRITPMVPGVQSLATVEGVLDELNSPENNAEFTTCTVPSTCPSGVPCTEGYCIPQALLSFVDRIDASSQFLSCTGDNSYEDTWPADRVTHLNTGSCGPSTLWQRNVYGYRAVNTTSSPMTFWVGKGIGQGKRWWTVNPGEDIRFNVVDGAFFFPTTASAYRACAPSFMAKSVQAQNLAPPSTGVQVNPVELVRYAPTTGGSFTLYRDEQLRTELDLVAYPNYFSVGISPKGSYGGSAPLTFVRYGELGCH